MNGLGTGYGVVRSVLPLLHEIRVLQARNAVETWQTGYESARFLAGYSFQLSPP